MPRLCSAAQWCFLAFVGRANATPVEHHQSSLTRFHASNTGLILLYSNYHPLSRIRRQPGLSRTMDALEQNRPSKAFKDSMGISPNDDPIGVDHTRDGLNQIEHIMEDGIGAESYYMILDTGSSDTQII